LRIKTGEEISQRERKRVRVPLSVRQIENDMFVLLSQ
jgi:hypothetical protein